MCADMRQKPKASHFYPADPSRYSFCSVVTDRGPISFLKRSLRTHTALSLPQRGLFFYTASSTHNVLFRGNINYYCSVNFTPTERLRNAASRSPRVEETERLGRCAAPADVDIMADAEGKE